MEMSKVSMKGVIDMHVHTNPDLRLRAYDDFEMMEAGIRVGARAIVLKTHQGTTMDRAYLCNRHNEIVHGKTNNFTMFGSITLNKVVGGINPKAVDVALKLGAKVVWLPTQSARNHMVKNNLDPAGCVDVVRDGKVVPELNDVFGLIRDHNAVKRNQVAGQPSLELMDQRNVLLDELSSYVPIEISYYKDDAHSGTYAYTYPKDHPSKPGHTEQRDRAYDYDVNGNIIGKREWPDDLKVDLIYKDANGVSQKVTLIEGSEPGKNYGQLEAVKADKNDISADRSEPSNIAIKFTGTGPNPDTVTAHAGGIQFSGGSIQASLDMLGKKGTGDPIKGTNNLDDVRGYQFYREKLDTLAKTFADQMNALNKAPNTSGGGDLFTAANGPIDASNISINTDWINGTIHIAKGPNNENDTVLAMLDLMKKTDINGMGGKTFADFMNHVSTQLASDSSANKATLKNQVTVLNSIQSSKDSLSGVSLDEEAANMMTYVSAYNAASRLMTTLDEVLNSLLSIGA